jgi:hypothetical protein
MFASLVLVGHSARLLRKLKRGSLISSNVLYYLRFLPPCRVSSRTLYTCFWLYRHRYRALEYLEGSRTPRSCRGVGV